MGKSQTKTRQRRDAKRFYEVFLPVKNYIYQWMNGKYGSSFRADLHTPLGAMVNIALMPRRNYDAPATRLKEGHSFYPMQVLCLPIATDGIELSPAAVELINAFIEELFKLDLYFWVKTRLVEGRYRGYDKAIEEFAAHYNIEIPEDISFEGLKRKEKRFRELFEEGKKKGALPCPFPQKAIASPSANDGKPLSIRNRKEPATSAGRTAPGGLQLVLLPSQ